jgi:hypothetical protein
MYLDKIVQSKLIKKKNVKRFVVRKESKKEKDG